MAHLLTLPRELRQEILELVAFARTPPAATLAEFEAQGPRSESGSHWELEDLPEEGYTAAPLLLVNKQIHAETKAILNLKGGLTYELDVKFVYESFLIPTWTSVPLPTDIVPLLRVTMQSLEKFFPGKTLWGHPLDPSYRNYHESYPPYIRELFALLRDLLTCGAPTRRATRQVAKKALAIRVLEIDCVDPPNAEVLAPESHNPDEYVCLQSNAQSMPSPGEQGLIRPEWLAHSITTHFPVLLSSGFYIPTIGQMVYNTLFYSRIGRIVVKANGTVIGTVDLGQIIADMKFRYAPSPWPMENWLDRWILWREEAVKRRAERGFGVVEWEAGWKERLRERHGYRAEMKSEDKEVVRRVELYNNLDDL